MSRRVLLTLLATLCLAISACASPGTASVQPTTSPGPTPALATASTPVATSGPTTTATSNPTPAPSPLVLWPAPSNPLALAVKAGLVPETKESLTFHVHAHLDVFKDGAPVEVPAGIGIDISNPGVQHGLAPDGSDLYGGIAGCDKPCISPLHTHDITGVLHTESKTPQPNTLGQFFTEWGVKLTAECVGTFCAPATPIAFYVDGKPFTGDPATILLEDHLEIAITIGSPPAVIPSAYDLSGG
jgi:hypothetical protein